MIVASNSVCGDDKNKVKNNSWVSDPQKDGVAIHSDGKKLEKQRQMGTT